MSLSTSVIVSHSLVQLELFISAGTVCMSLYSLVAAIFGMNIPYTWKAPGHEHVFKWVCTYHLQQYEKGISNILTNFCQINKRMCMYQFV